MKTPCYDFLIVGQGLAGSVLAHKLISAGKSVMVIDNHHSASSSIIAAGIINPITGHRLNITRGFEQYYNSAKRYYKTLETQFNVQIWRSIKQIRLIKNSGQLDYLQKRLIQVEYQNLLSELQNSSEFPNASIGCSHVSKTAIINTAALLNNIKIWMLERNTLQLAKLDYKRIKVSEQHCSFDSVTAKHLIFCEGYQAIDNPWLQELPFKLSKGEILTLDTKRSSNVMLNWGNWLVCNPHEQYPKLGSNYEWNNLSLRPSQGVKTKLLSNLKKQTNIETSILNHQTGIRPTTLDRLPFVGPIRKLTRSYCFNGFGSKGCLLIPYYADLLVSHLLERTELPNEVTKCL